MAAEPVQTKSLLPQIGSVPIGSEDKIPDHKIKSPLPQTGSVPIGSEDLVHHGKPEHAAKHGKAIQRRQHNHQKLRTDHAKANHQKPKHGQNETSLNGTQITRNPDGSELRVSDHGALRVTTRRDGSQEVVAHGVTTMIHAKRGGLRF